MCNSKHFRGLRVLRNITNLLQILTSFSSSEMALLTLVRNILEGKGREYTRLTMSVGYQLVLADHCPGTGGGRKRHTIFQAEILV